MFPLMLHLTTTLLKAIYFTPHIMSGYQEKVTRHTKRQNKTTAMKKTQNPPNQKSNKKTPHHKTIQRHRASIKTRHDMARVLELLNQDFKTTMMNTLRALS